MAQATSHVTTPPISSSTAGARRHSFRRSLDECGLPADSLEALEEKRRALDDSIHKYIAAKEREYKQFEKELRYKARRLSGGDDRDTTVTAASDVTTQHAGVGPGQTSQPGPAHEASVKRKSKKRHEDFPGVFTPEYIEALNHHNAVDKASSEQIRRPADGTDSKNAVSTTSIARENTNPATVEPAVRPSRLLLAQRTSSSGSSVDGRLVSALKSAVTSSPNISKVKRKRVSLAVGDAIVAPSDNVPVALTVNSSSSHSRPRTPARERQSFLSTEHHQPESTSHQNALTGTTSTDVAETPQEKEIAQPVNEKVATQPTKKLDGDVGDMFDLEDSDLDSHDTGQEHAFDDDEEDHEDTLEPVHDGSQIAGRLRRPQRTESDSLDDLEDDTGEPPPDDDIAVALSYTEKGSHSLREPGFRRPSVSTDPVYAGRDYGRVEEGAEESGMYSSSFSRPTSKGSFTSGSLGESFMARNAEKMMGLRAQQRDTDRTPHPPHALPVR